MTPAQRLGLVGAGLFAMLVLVALFAPWLAPYDPTMPVGTPLQPPSGRHPLGTDDIGQDLLSQVLIGARISLLVGVLGAALATAIGITLGLVAGSAGRVTDAVLMRAVDVMLTLPALPLFIVLQVALGAGLTMQILVIGLVLWARTARVLRAQILTSRERDAVSAARVMGAGRLHILRLHLLPAVLPLVIPELVRAVNAAVTIETSLSFLGFGDPTARSWGTILYYANARNAALTSAWPWWVVPPGLGVALTILSVAFIGYALEAAARPALDSARPLPARAPRRGSPLVEDPHAAAAEADRVAIEYRSPRGAVVRAVDEVSLVVPRGAIVGLVGESGSGKTTLASALLQLGRPPGLIAGGRLLVTGREVAALDAQALHALRGGTVALVPQNAMNALNPVLTIGAQLRETLIAHARLDPAAIGARASELLDAVGLSPSRAGAYPHELSGGMRQRVVIAMAMAHAPRLLIADEPTTGLDVLRQVEILHLLRGLRERFGTAILLISHDLSAVASIADRLVVMQAGRVVEAGAARTVMAAPRHDYTRRLVAATPPLHGDGRRRAAAVTSSTPVLEVRDLRRTFASRHGAAAVTAADGISFVVGRGEAVGLVGASGAGKSTVARLIAGLDRADGGQILLDGAPCRVDTAAERRALGRRVHLIFQDPYESLPAHLRVRRILEEPAAIHPEADVLPVDEALAAVALTPPARFADRFPHQLSGGERQRVALARALALRPSLVIADEPTSLLDLSLRMELLALMQEARRRFAIAYLYITHDLALARAFCDRLVILHDGRVVETGGAAEVIDAPRDPYTASLVKAAETLASPPAPRG